MTSALRPRSANTATPSKSQSHRQCLFLSGTPGLSPDGHLSDCFEEQSDQAWRNVFELLEHAGMGRENLVEVTQYLVRQEHMPSIRRFVPSGLEMDMERETAPEIARDASIHPQHLRRRSVGVREVSPTHAPVNCTFSRTLVGGAGRQ